MQQPIAFFFTGLCCCATGFFIARFLDPHFAPAPAAAPLYPAPVSVQEETSEQPATAEAAAGDSAKEGKAETEEKEEEGEEEEEEEEEGECVPPPMATLEEIAAAAREEEEDQEEDSEFIPYDHELKMICLVRKDLAM